jgi:hypothetical protein
MTIESISFKSVSLLGVKITGEWMPAIACTLKAIDSGGNIVLEIKTGNKFTCK